MRTTCQNCFIHGCHACLTKINQDIEGSPWRLYSCVFPTTISSFLLLSPAFNPLIFLYLPPNNAGSGCRELRQQYYLFKDSLEVCHHFPLPLVSLQHLQKEIIKEHMSGKDVPCAVRKLALQPSRKEEVINASKSNFIRVHLSWRE